MQYLLLPVHQQELSALLARATEPEYGPALTVATAEGLRLLPYAQLEYLECTHHVVLRSRRKPFRSRHRCQLYEIQVEPLALGVTAQKCICVRQLLHDARILPPGKIFHALAFQPAAQGCVRAAYRNVKDHPTFPSLPAARLDFCAGLEYDK